jgi:hypothetical protein
MSLNYTKIQVQLAAILKVSQKIKAIRDHAAKSNDASYNSRLFTAANGYDTSVTVEKRAYGEQVKFFDGTMLDAVVALWDGYKQQVEKVDDFFGVLADGLGFSEEELGGEAIGYEYDPILAQEGHILLVNKTGILGALDKDMRENDQYVDANVVTLGGSDITPLNGNRGEIEAASMTALSQLPTGKLVFECVNERVDQCRIQLTFEYPQSDPNPDGTDKLAAQNFITAEQSYEDYWLGLTGVLLNRPGLADPTKTGDDDDFFTGGGTFEDPKEVDMRGGVLYLRITRRDITSEEWLIEFFSDSSRTNKRGAVVTGTMVGSYSIDKTLIGGTRFTETFDRAAAAAVLTDPGDTLETISYDIRTPRQGDKWEREVTNDEQFNYVSKIKRLWRWTPPTAGVSKWTNANAASVSMT